MAGVGGGVPLSPTNHFVLPLCVCVNCYQCLWKKLGIESSYIVYHFIWMNDDWSSVKKLMWKGTLTLLHFWFLSWQTSAPGEKSQLWAEEHWEEWQSSEAQSPQWGPGAWCICHHTPSTQWFQRQWRRSVQVVLVMNDYRERSQLMNDHTRFFFF